MSAARSGRKRISSTVSMRSHLNTVNVASSIFRYSRKSWSALSMRYVPSPPSVAAGLSGFVIGVILTLILVGTLGHHTESATPPATLPPATPLGDSLMKARLSKLLNRLLGPGYPDLHTPRLVHLNLIPASIGPVPLGTLDRDTPYRTVQIVMRLNDHPLGKLWRLRAAK